MPLIITDIDGTLLDNGQPIQPVIDWITQEAEEVYILTNRPESERDQTVEDLKATGLAYDKLIMNGGDLPAPEFKASVVQALIDSGEEPDYFIDNSKPNRDAVEALGVEVIDPADIVAGNVPFSEEAMSANIMDTPKNLTPELRLKAAEASVTAMVTERDSLRADFEALTAKHMEATAAIEKAALEHTEKVAALTASLDAAVAKAAALETEVADLKSKSESVATVAAKELAAIGLEKPLAVTAATPAGKDEGTILEQYAALTGQARLDFFAANKRAIFAARSKQG